MNTEWSARIAASEARLKQLATVEPARASVIAMAPELIAAGDEGDLAQVVIDGEIAQRVADLRASLQEQLSRALDRLALGRYGYCEDCNEAIVAERMEFAPETTTCVTCQARRDRNR